MAIAIALLVIALVIALIADRRKSNSTQPRVGPKGTPRPDADSDR